MIDVTFKGLAVGVVFSAMAIGVVTLLWGYLRSRRSPEIPFNIPGPVPSVEAMLRIGKDLGYTMTPDAYDQYMHHWDCFFSVDKFAEQYTQFIDELSVLGLIENNTVCDIPIAEALARVEELSWK